MDTHADYQSRGMGWVGFVRVVRLGVKSLVVDDVLEGVVHESTLARVITLRDRAVHQLLLRKHLELARGDLDSSLGRSSGRE